MKDRSAEVRTGGGPEARRDEDITELERSKRALRGSEERLRLLADNALDVIWTMSADWSFTYVSPSVEKLRGYTPAEVLKQSLHEVLTPESAALAIEEIRAYMEERASISDLPSRRWELEQPCKDGTTVWTETTISTLRDDDGGFAGIVGVTRDISARRRSERERARLEEELHQAQKMESIGRLAGGVAHDFNNMLGVILGNVEMALDELEPHHPVREMLVEVQSAAKRSADLTRQLLAFARRQTIKPRELDLNEIVERTIGMLERVLGEHITLEWRPGEALWPVSVDPSQVDQILTHLCVNARDAISGPGHIRIATGNTSITDADSARDPHLLPGEWVHLTVTDDGAGMAPETLAHLFEPFFTTKGMGRGAGLGLATVYGAVKQSGGFVSVSSRPSAGTAFTIYLPRHARRRAALAPDVAPVHAASGLGTILVVEDEPAILGVTQRMLRHLGYEVLAAQSPTDALRIADQHRGPIHALLTDVVMPEMNGRDLAAALERRFPRLRCLFMSGYTADVIAPHGVIAAEVQFIQKPFTRELLAEKLRQALGRG